MPKIKLIIGPIASYKSTLTKRFALAGDIIVNDDAITTAVHGGDYTLYDSKLKPLYKSVEHQIISMALSMGRNVVIDRPNFRASTRRRYIELARSFDMVTIGYIMTRCSPEVHAERRAKSDVRGHTMEYWLGVAKAHDALWQEPQIDEGFEKFIYIDDISNLPDLD